MFLEHPAAPVPHQGGPGNWGPHQADKSQIFLTLPRSKIQQINEKVLLTVEKTNLKKTTEL